MIRFLIQKIFHKKWIVLSLMIGYILLIAIATSHPMYRDASLHRMLTDEFVTAMEKKNIYPALITLKATLDKGDNTEFNTMDSLSYTICDKLGLELYQRIAYYSIASARARTVEQREENIGEMRVFIGSLTDFKDNIDIVSGDLYSSALSDDGFIEAVVSHSALAHLDLLIGEELIFGDIYDKNNNPIKIRIVGVYENNGKNNEYWVTSPNNYKYTCMIDEELFKQLFQQEGEDRFLISGTWYVQPDYNSFTPDRIDEVVKLTKAYAQEYTTKSAGLIPSGYVDILTNFGSNQNKINITLAILQVPVIVLLCAFLYMISGQMLRLEQNEISQLKSRGAGRLQLITIYTIQSLILAFISMLIGIPLGSYLCRVLGSSNAFLEFVQRRPLNVEITLDVIIYAFMAYILCVLVSVIPVINYSNISIVHLKQKSMKKARPFWHKFYLDIILILISLYGLYIFNNQKDELVNKVLSGASLDPLLFLSSSLFILGFGLLALRIQPLFIRLMFIVRKRYWKPANYVSFLQTLRTGGKQHFIMIFLVLTVSLGMFYATIARTILSNAEQNRIYNMGSDIVLEEVWESDEGYLDDPTAEKKYTEPDFNRYSQIDGVISAARVYKIKDNVSFRHKNERKVSSLMAINSKEFGETTYINDNLLPVPYREYLNAFATNSNAILVSSNFKTLFGYKIGDTLNYSNYANKNISGVIYGFFDYWPTYVPTSTYYTATGEAVIIDRFLIVSHLSTIQNNWGLNPYEVWLKVDESSDFIYDYIEENGIKLSKFAAISQELREIRNETLFQGTNGILTLSFIVILLLCSVGFLIYWILSIRSRELLFGVFRAMGMTRREIIHMLVNEQIFTGLYSIAVGAVIGHFASKWYVPLIQTAYAAADQVLPLELITQESDIIRLFIVILMVFIFCMAILIRLIFKMKIAQALKLGED